MFKHIIILSLFFSLAFAGKVSFEQKGVSVQLKDKQGKPYEIHVKRNIPEECKKVKIDNATLWTGNFAHKSVPEACKVNLCSYKRKALAYASGHGLRNLW